MLLSNNIALFKRLIERISRDKLINEIYIEKDFYAISILKELVLRDPEFVFKGGTSLSVCQKAINRFSEDIDISYSRENITTGQRKKIKQIFFESIKAVSLDVSNPDNIRSRKVFNRYLCSYLSTCNSTNNQVIVEWSTITPSFPIETKLAQTIIGKYLDEINRHDLVEQYGLEEFEVKTITKERTLIDKLFAICDYYLLNKITRQSRHIYDIHQLLTSVELDNNFINLLLQVKSYRKLLESCYSAKEGITISSVLEKIINEKTYLNDYKNITIPLLYDQIPYETCISSIKYIIVFLKNNSL